MPTNPLSIPRPGNHWGRLECLRIISKPVMLPDIGGGEYHSGEYRDSAIELRCDCGTVFEFPIDRWPGKHVLKSCSTCVMDEPRGPVSNLPKKTNGIYPRRLESSAMWQIYLPISWKRATDEIYLNPANNDSKNVILESRFRKLFELAQHYIAVTGTENELEEFLADPLYAALERGRLKQTQMLIRSDARSDVRSESNQSVPANRQMERSDSNQRDDRNNTDG